MKEIRLRGGIESVELTEGTLTIVCDGQSLVFPIAQQEVAPAPRRPRAPRTEATPVPKPSAAD